MQESLIKIRVAMERIMFRSATNKDFRERCLKDGTTLFVEETSLPLDKDVTIEFVENSYQDKQVATNGKDIVFILPDFVGAVNKLDNNDLEGISGGVTDAMVANLGAIESLFYNIFE